SGPSASCPGRPPGSRSARSRGATRSGPVGPVGGPAWGGRRAGEGAGGRGGMELGRGPTAPAGGGRGARRVLRAGAGRGRRTGGPRRGGGVRRVAGGGEARVDRGRLARGV